MNVALTAVDRAIAGRVIFWIIVASLIVSFLTCTSSLTIFASCKVKDDKCDKNVGLFCDSRKNNCNCKDRHKSWDPSQNKCAFGFRGPCKSNVDCFKGLVCGQKEGCELPQPEDK